MLKPWGFIASSKRLATHFQECRCPHRRNFKHAPIEGGDSRRSAYFPEGVAGLRMSHCSAAPKLS